MPQVGDDFLREQLLERRQRLEDAIVRSGPTSSLSHRVEEVDAALARMDRGEYGICETCHEAVEKDRLIADPLVTLCLDHLTTDQRRALERDLDLAGRIQRQLLPAPNVAANGWQVHYRYEPAGPVSGDYCDVIVAEPKNGDVLFLLGDVSGKGVAASMLMSHLHAMFRSLVTVGVPLDRLIGVANSVFCESTFAGQYATLICGRASSSGSLEIASAGHIPALLLHSGKATRVESTGLPLGMFRDSTFEVRCLDLVPGDTLLLYTDGLTEARPPGQNATVEYGAERLSHVAGKHRASSPQEIAAACLADVAAYRQDGPLTDDATLMVVRRGN